MQNPLPAALSTVIVGSPVTRANLTMIPLVGPPAVEREPFYLTLDEAVRQRQVEVGEVSERGRVSELRIRNRGVKPVFILDGEELPGATRNRIVNLSLLVPAGSGLEIPFSSAPSAPWAASRARRMALTTLSMQLNKYSADRADGWTGLSTKAERTDAIADRTGEELCPVGRQCGALFMVDGTIIGFDLFDSAVTLRRLLPYLVRSATTDALNRSGDAHQAAEPQLAQRMAGSFLAQVAAAPVHASKAIGDGDDIRIIHPDLSGGALAVKNTAIHMAGFAVE